MVEKRQVKLAKNAEDMERWLRKLVRAANEVDRLRRERKRLLKPQPLPKEATDLPSDPLPTFAPSPPTPPEKAADLDIPDYLKRKREGDAKDAAFKAKLTAEIAETSKAKTERAKKKRAINKETLDAELTGKRRAMPLTGKAALDAIRAGR